MIESRYQIFIQFGGAYSEPMVVPIGTDLQGMSLRYACSGMTALRATRHVACQGWIVLVRLSVESHNENHWEVGGS